MSKYGLSKEKIESHITNIEYQRFSKTGTLCVITLHNGYTVTGESGCIDPETFNEEIGKGIAYNNAFEKLWGILGYVEKQRWYRETQLTYADRLAEELSDLDEKRTKLIAFLANGQPNFISNEKWELLIKQEEVMGTYALILQERLALAMKG